MAIRIPKHVHEIEFKKLQEEYEIEFGKVEDQEATAYYSKQELVHLYAQNLSFWSSRLIDDPMHMTQIDDVARRAICENSCINLRQYLKKNEIEEDVNQILDDFKSSQSL
tara:strand:+ start:6288 stop:6617 length:330 start_codon:yes stop_codon:yes gene_type:complete